MRYRPRESVSADFAELSAAVGTTCTTAPSSGRLATLSYTDPTTVIGGRAAACCAYRDERDDERIKANIDPRDHRHLAARHT